MKLINLIATILLTLVFFSCNKRSNVVYLIDAEKGGKDAILSLSNKKKNYGNDKELNIYCDSLNGIRHINRAIVYFDLHHVPKEIEIDSVFLQLYFNETSGLYKLKKAGHSGNTSLIVESIEEEWDEKLVSWARYPKVGSKKLYFETHKIASQDFRLDLTALLVSTSGQLKQTQGLLLRLREEQNGNYIHLSSRENRKTNNSPKLRIYAKK